MGNVICICKILLFHGSGSDGFAEMYDTRIHVMGLDPAASFVIPQHLKTKR